MMRLLLNLKIVSIEHVIYRPVCVWLIILTLILAHDDDTRSTEPSVCEIARA